jgi:hypothetical protein
VKELAGDDDLVAFADGEFPGVVAQPENTRAADKESAATMTLRRGFMG